jgi:hypothetical protein
VLRLSDAEAFDTFKRVRFAANDGEPFCPHCGVAKVYTLAETPIRWKCSNCRKKFSVTSGTLFQKRRELAGTIDTLQEQLDQHYADLAHVDGALRLLGHRLDPDTIRPKSRYRRLALFDRNELSRLVLTTLRTAAGESIGIEEIGRRVILAKGFDASDAALRAAVWQRLRAILTRLHKQGVIEGVSGGRGSKWKLADI